MTKQKKCQCCEQKRYEADFTVCRTCYQDKGESMDNTNGPTVINGLLAYVSTYQHRSSNFQLKIAISAHYQENDIEDAKKDLIKGLEGLNLPLGDNVKERQNSANRSAKEAAIDDILNIFRICDQHELNKGPIYCATDLSKLPPAPPEASGSMLSVFDILSKQEQQITALYTALTEVRAEIADMKAKPAAMSFSSMPHHSSPSYAAIATENSRNTQPTPRHHGSAAGVRSAAGVGLTAGIGATGVGTSEDPRQPDAAGFTTVENKRKFKAREKTKGTGDADDALQAGPTKFTIQITNVNPEKTEDDIKEYINKKENAVQPCEIVDASEEGWDTKRFLITFPIKAFDAVMSGDYWPDRIYFRQWFTRGKPRNKDAQSKPGWTT